MSSPTTEPLVLLTYKNNPRCMKIYLTAAYAGVALREREDFDFGTESCCSNKSASFMRNAHPLGMVPVLETPDGNLFDSFAITRHLARLGRDKGLYGPAGTVFQESQCDQWLEFASQELSSFVVMILAPLYGYVPHNGPAEEEALKQVQSCMAGMDTWLETRTFFVGERLTVADIALSCTLLPLFQDFLTPDAVSLYPHLVRWMQTCEQQPLFQSVLSPGKLLQGPKRTPYSKASPSVSPKKSAENGKKSKDAKKKKQKKEGDESGAGDEEGGESEPVAEAPSGAAAAAQASEQEGA